MPIDDRTTNRSYALPNVANQLVDDVARLRETLQSIDADIFARYTKTEVDALIAGLIAGAPGALNTLNELAAALGDDANFAATVTTALSNRYTKTEADALLGAKANSSDVYTKTETEAFVAQKAGFRNAIINGNFDIWQQGTTHATNGYGSADRWKNYIVGSSCTISRQAFTPGQTVVPGNPRFFCRAVVSSVAGAGNYAIIGQLIEGVQTFSGQTITISFYAKADAAKSISIELTQGFGSGGSATVEGIGATKINLTTSWQLFTITTVVPSISGKTIGSDDSLGVNFWFDAGSSWNSRSASLGQQSGTFDISRVQIEAGSIATPFEQRALATELALCKRYGQWVPYNMFFYAAGAVQMESTLTWPEMRKVPLAGVLVADPSTTQANANNAQNSISRMTPYGGSCVLVAAAAGNCYVVGYRSWLDAEY